MKLHYFRPAVFVFTFILGFLVAPTQFRSIGNGLGALTGGHNSCNFTVYSSTNLEELSRWSCSFEEESQARDYFDTLSPANATIEKSDSYVFIRIKEPMGDYFCSSRRDGRFITNVCSHSIRDIKSYERHFLQ